MYFSLNFYLLWHALQRSSLILPISRTMKKQLIKEGIDDAILHVLPMGVNSTLFSSNLSQQLSHEDHGNNGIIKMVYLGSMSKSRNLSLLLNAFNQCYKRCSNSRLMMIGDGDDRKTLENMTKLMNISAVVIFTGMLPQNEAAGLMRQADIGLCIVPPTDEFTLSSPTKLFEYMAMGLPVIVNRGIVELEDVSRLSGGCVLANYNPVSISDAMVMLVQSRKERLDMGKSGHNWVLSNRTYAALSKDLHIRIIDSIGKEKSMKTKRE